MATWKVYGSIPVSVTVTVDADTKEDAIEVAYEEFEGLTNYAGNGGTDKIIGTSDENVSLNTDYNEPKFTDAEPA